MKKMNLIGAAAAISALYVGIPSQQAQAHGWAEFPEARQSICYEQGGLWSGTPPNAACAQAKEISGTYPFIQRNEFAINIPAPTYNDMDVVKAAIPDGSLCYANDAQKRGMGAEHSAWTRTELSTGEFEYVFNATAPHNPSFWQFYLTKPGVDVSKPLNWDDLELIQEYGNVAVGADRKYRMNIAIPADRSGDAILYTRWQREDPVGEGFYNCSDITITGDAPIDPEPTEPYLEQGDAFIPDDVSLTTPQLGESVNYKVFNKNGEIHSSFSLEITEDNQLDWDRLLASQVNGYYQDQYEGNVFIGRWHAEMTHYMYFQGQLHNNFFNSKDLMGYGEFSITANNEFIEAVITPTVLKSIVDATVTHGEYVVLTPANSQGEIEQLSWMQVSGLPVETELGQNDELIINTALLENTAQTFSFELTAAGQGEEDKTIYSFSVAPTDVEPGPGPGPEPIDQWSAAKVYNGGETVTHNNQQWTAQWWTQGEEPGTTGEWGVWR
ncbi:lytic polysaccharide monooxygenase [Shewanella olleyana]|uniref:lytic polysaccharide monooxygenase n=1 Tax=Shewanella olleyana TaxID=135626 RepID=UPI00200D79EE|nr:lytic polysaccharide monooxygenase [Shewanella olleyana]MCL1067825.1 lytic polysaccharide monooxygenase [Shewanella olleyana]